MSCTALLQEWNLIKNKNIVLINNVTLIFYFRVTHCLCTDSTRQWFKRPTSVHYYYMGLVVHLKASTVHKAWQLAILPHIIKLSDGTLNVLFWHFQSLMKKKIPAFQKNSQLSIYFTYCSTTTNINVILYHLKSFPIEYILILISVDISFSYFDERLAHVPSSS